MFNLGFSEIVVLAVIGLLVLGPDQLPQVARKVARMINDFKRATEEAMSPVEDLKHQARNFIDKTRETAQKWDEEQTPKHHVDDYPGDGHREQVEEPQASAEPEQLELTENSKDPKKSDV